MTFAELLEQARAEFRSDDPFPHAERRRAAVEVTSLRSFDEIIEVIVETQERYLPDYSGMFAGTAGSVEKMCREVVACLIDAELRRQFNPQYVYPRRLTRSPW